MKRQMMAELVKWKASKYRKPLILRGIRQCGKTWLLKEFGKDNYHNIAYINFDENPEYNQFFELTKNPKRIIESLEIALGMNIEKGNTLIIFDEIQESNEALNSLKYFEENASDYHIVCAGSLLGITLSKPKSFPVGKVDFMKLYPMSFYEFLDAYGKSNLLKYLKTSDTIEVIPDLFFNQLTEALKVYFIIGGLPEVILRFIEEKNMDLVERTLEFILLSYEHDFMKYPNIKDLPKIKLIWDSIPSQLAKENKKFLYKVVKSGARAREYEDALRWLIDADMISQVYRSSKPGLPLSVYDDLSAFKIYLSDVGLLRKKSKMSTNIFTQGDKLFTEFKGSFTENYVINNLVRILGYTPRYWTPENANIKAEIDFLIQIENDIYPVEAKAGINIKSTSLKKYMKMYPEETKLRIRYSLKNLSFNGNILNIPLFMIEDTLSLVNKALDLKKGNI